MSQLGKWSTAKEYFQEQQMKTWTNDRKCWTGNLLKDSPAHCKKQHLLLCMVSLLHLDKNTLIDLFSANRKTIYRFVPKSWDIARIIQNNFKTDLLLYSLNLGYLGDNVLFSPCKKCIASPVSITSMFYPLLPNKANAC